jgi:hypothetical protein
MGEKPLAEILAFLARSGGGDQNDARVRRYSEISLNFADAADIGDGRKRELDREDRMSDHAVVHRVPSVSLKAHVLNAHLASIAAWRVGEKKEAIALMFAGRRVWETEEEARHGRRRSLIDDNPAAG